MSWLRRAQPKSRQLGPFGLRGTALFVLAASMYLSMLVSVAALFKGRSPATWGWFLVALLILVAWAVLLPIYRFWGVKLAMRIHWIGPAMMLVIVLVPLLLFRFSLVLTAMAVVCGLCTLVSFPTTVILMARDARRRRSRTGKGRS